MWAKYSKKSGFTIVELLIVIVVIAVLAAITVVAHNGIQTRSKTTKVNTDIANLVKAIQSARISVDGPLLGITGTGCSGCSFPYTVTDTTPYNTLPKTHACWVRYYSKLDAIAAAAGANLNSLKAGDPWGNPYWIDENEAEGGGCGLGRDSIRSVGSSGYVAGATFVGQVTVPYYTPGC